LLLDEPTRGLDARLRQAFYEVLKTTRERLHAPIVLVTHDLDECMQVADYVYLMEAGRFTQCGPRDQLFACPANLEVARALGIYNLIPAAIQSLDPGRNTSKLEVLGEKIDGPYFKGHLIGDHGYLCIRQTEMRIAPKTGQLTLSIKNVSPSMRGVRIEFENNVVAEMSHTEYAMVRGQEQLRVEIPSSAVYFLAK
jgi:ABC-type sulfate/molybdate transport systems ATPase subunit